MITLSMKMDDLEPELLRVAKLLHDGKVKPGEIDPAMVKKIANQLMQGVFKGYGKDLTSKALTDSERTFLTQINNTVYVFSGFKNYQQLKETSLLLKTDDGKIKPFNDFLADVKAVDKTYNEVYLGAEYGNAIASGQMAQAWQDYETNGIEMLTYRTANDDRVRDDHAVLEGVTYPIDHEFWDTYFPPNDWGCRCDAEPSVEEKPNKINAIELPDVPPMFQNNVGKSGVVFPDTHPYFEASKADKLNVLQQVAGIIKEDRIDKFAPANFSNYAKTLSVEIDKEIFTYLKEDTKLTNKDVGANYNHQTKTVNLPFDQRRKLSPWNAKAVVYHEFGHAADFQSGYQKLDSVKSLMTEYRSKYGGEFKRLSSVMKDEARAAIKIKDHDTVEQITASLDTIMSLDKRFGLGHGYKVTYGKKKIDYFDVPGCKEAEFIAHAFENRFAGNPVFEKHMPDLYKDMIQLTKGFK